MNAQELMKKMQVLQYGWYDYKHKRIITPKDKEFGEQSYFEENCYVLKPDDVWKYKVGTCWDFTLVEALELSKTYEEVSPYYAEFKKDGKLITHSFVTYKDELGVYRWFEYAWSRFAGINGPYGHMTAVSSNVYECIQTTYGIPERAFECANRFRLEDVLKLDNITSEDFMYTARNSGIVKWLREPKPTKGK